MMTHQRRNMRLTILGATGMAILALSACSDSSSEPATGGTVEAELLSVTPTGGSTDVSRTSTVRVEFDRPMADGTDAYCRLHVGGIDGPDVAGAWTWSDDHRSATFTPAEPMAQATEHTFHLGGGIMDADGHHVNYAMYGFAMGGMHVDGGMMGGGMMGGSSHGGGLWQGPDGGYGMVFRFRTGS